ncbi:MAG: glycosyltransferase [Prevotella sp.]|nr:glycosyltransferase [Prevotella sp.]
MEKHHNLSVYITTKAPIPNGMALTNRIICLAKAIVSVGIPCKIIIFTRTEIYGKDAKNLIGKGCFEGIEYQYIGKTPLRGSNPFIRTIHDIQDKIHLLLYLFINLNPNDIVINIAGRDVKFINLLTKLIHYKKAKFVKELCELPYGTGKETLKNINKREYTLKSQFPKCDGIIAISDALLSLSAKYTSPNCQLIKIPILVDFEKYRLPDCSSEVSIPYIFHSGTLFEQKDGILGVLEAFGKAVNLLDCPIQFISTGNPQQSPHRHEINQIIKQYQLQDKVIFKGYLNNEQLKDYLSKSSLVIINKYPNQQNTYCFSTKLGEYLAARKPVIITNVGEAMNWLKNRESAYIIEPNNTDLLAKAIIDAFQHPEICKAIGKRGQEVCAISFNYRRYGVVLKDYFCRIINNK